jgi:hypothetical protein
MAVLAAGSLWGVQASAERARVALVWPEISSGAARQALNLIQGELTGDGFDVVLVESADESQSTDAGTPDRRIVASIEVTVDEGGRAAELRVIDRLTNKTVSRHTEVDSVETAQVAQILAVRAVELLRASLVELLIEEPAKPLVLARKDQTARVSRWVERSLDRVRRSTWGFDVGAAGLVGFGGIEPAVLGLVRARASMSRSLQLRATFAGLGTEPDVSSSVGSARLTEQLGLLEGVLSLWPESVVHPVVSVGVGAIYITADGQAGGLYRGVSAWALGLIEDVGSGVAIRLDRSFEVSLEVHAFFTQPSFVFQFADQSGPGVSQPSLLGTLTIVGWP